MFIKDKEMRTEVNEKIFDKEVRVIDVNGNDLGIMPTQKALKFAFESGELDLVKVAPNEKPPICRVMDYGKFCFEKAKKEKEKRKNQRTMGVKEIRLTVTTGENDMKIKANKVAQFIKNGDKVKVVLRFRGRESVNSNVGFNVMNQFFDICNSVCNGAVVKEKEPCQETRKMFMFLAPNFAKKNQTSAADSSLEENNKVNSVEVGENGEVPSVEKS